jgi:hypothetical protein
MIKNYQLCWQYYDLNNNKVSSGCGDPLTLQEASMLFKAYREKRHNPLGIKYKIVLLCRMEE